MGGCTRRGQEVILGFNYFFLLMYTIVSGLRVPHGLIVEIVPGCLGEASAGADANC